MSEKNLEIRHGIYKVRYVQIPAIVLADKELSPGAKLVLGVIADFVSAGDGTIFPSQRLIADRLALSTRQVRRYLNELKEKGYLDWERRGLPGRNYYYLNCPVLTHERFNLEAWHISGETINRINAMRTNVTTHRTDVSEQERTLPPDRTDMSGLDQSEMTGLGGAENPVSITVRTSKSARYQKNITEEKTFSNVTSTSNVTNRETPRDKEEFVKILKDLGFKEEEIGGE